MESWELFGPGDVNQWGDLPTREEALAHMATIRAMTAPPLTEVEQFPGLSYTEGLVLEHQAWLDAQAAKRPCNGQT